MYIYIYDDHNTYLVLYCCTSNIIMYMVPWSRERKMLDFPIMYGLLLGQMKTNEEAIFKAPPAMRTWSLDLKIWHIFGTYRLT